MTFIVAIADELGTDEESGKDWSDLEREAAEEDRNYTTKEDFPAMKSKKSSHGSSSRDRHSSSKHKSSKRFVISSATQRIQ